MWFRLALSLGMTVKEAQARIDSREFAEWVAFYGLEPFGPQAEDVRGGILAAVTANAFRGKGAAARPADYMLGEKPKPTLDPEAIKAKIKAAAAVNAKKKGKRHGRNR